MRRRLEDLDTGLAKGELLPIYAAAVSRENQSAWFALPARHFRFLLDRAALREAVPGRTQRSLRVFRLARKKWFASECCHWCKS
jgi:hypothetical protein